MPKTQATIKSHAVKIVEKRQLSDGAISFRARCCDDPSTDSWHTIYLHHQDDIVEVMKQNPHNQQVPIVGPKDATEAFLRSELDSHKARVSRLHDIRSSIDEIAESLVEG